MTPRPDISPDLAPDPSEQSQRTGGFRWRSVWIWLLILGPVSIITSDWMLFHAVILFSVGPSLIGASMSKRGSYLLPFTIAFCISLSIAVIGHGVLAEIGIAGFLPGLLGQGPS